jgi:lysophospholipase L1-like esterase
MAILRLIILSLLLLVPSLAPAQLVNPSAPAGAAGFIPGNTITSIGDSRIQSQCQDYPSCNNVSARSFINWANALSGRRMVIMGQYGVAGDTTTQMLARLPAALARKTAFLIIWGGVNDIGAGTTETVPFANIVTMANSALAQGTRPIIMLDTGSGAFTTAQTGYINDYNQRILQYAAGTAGVIVVDPREVVLAHTNTGSTAYKAGFSQDGLHSNLLGYYWTGVAFAQLIQQLMPPLPQQPTLQTDSRGFGSSALLVNSMFTNTTGGTLGAGASGTAPPNGFTVFTGGPTGATVAVSIAAATVTDITGAAQGNELVLAATCTSAATPAAPQTISIQQGLTNADFTGGVTQAVAGAEISVTAGATGLAGITTYMNVASAAATNVVYDLYPDPGINYGQIPGGYTAVAQTPVITAPAGTITGSNWFTRAYCSSAGTFTFRVRRPWARKVLP